MIKDVSERNFSDSGDIYTAKAAINVKIRVNTSEVTTPLKTEFNVLGYVDTVVFICLGSPPILFINNMLLKRKYALVSIALTLPGIIWLLRAK